MPYYTRLQNLIKALEHATDRLGWYCDLLDYGRDVYVPYWFKRIRDTIFHKDLLDANSKLAVEFTQSQREYERLSLEEWPSALPTDISSLELDQARHYYDQILENRLRVLDRTDAVNTAASLVLAATVAFLTLSAPTRTLHEAATIKDSQLHPLLLISYLAGLLASLLCVRCLSRSFREMKASQVEIAEPPSFMNSDDSLILSDHCSRAMLQSSRLLRAAMRVNAADSVIRNNYLDAATTDITWALWLLVCLIVLRILLQIL